MDDFLQNLVDMLVQHAPVYLALFAGLIFAVARWPSHPGASARAVIGLAWLLLFGLLADGWRELRIYELLIPDEHSHWLTDDLTCTFFYGLQSLGVIWILWAIYTGRPWRHTYRARYDSREDVEDNASRSEREQAADRYRRVHHEQ